jgi:DNA-binding transcriptional MerR regulator
MTGDTPSYHTVLAAACQRRIVSYVTSDDDNDLTIDELARTIGMTVRNIRAHQSRGLLPPPELRGRTGYYGAEHIARLKLIQELQTDGFNLDLIRRLLEGAGGSSNEVLRFKQALAQPFGGEEPETVGIADLIAEWGTADPAVLVRSLSLGLLRPLPDGRFEVPSPRLAKAGRELQRLGVPLERSLEFTATVREHADRLAQIYVDLFLETVWTPFERAGRPSEGWPAVQEALERLHPLASESLLAIFGMAMKSAVDRESARALKRMAGDGSGAAAASGGAAASGAAPVPDLADPADPAGQADPARVADRSS